MNRTALGWRALAAVVVVAAANGLLLLALRGLGAPAAGGPAPTAAPLLIEAAPPSPPPSPSPSLSPPPAVALPPRRTPTPGRLSPGELPVDTAVLISTAATGFPVTITRLQATCSRSGDTLGLLGSLLQGPTTARYQIAIAPFRGSGSYRTDASSGQIGGSIGITGQLQLFIGPPFETTAEIARDGALGQVAFSGTGVDGRPVDGLVRWECGELKRAG